MRRRICLLLSVAALLLYLGSVRCSAAVTDIFDKDVERIENSVGGDVTEDLSGMNAGSIKQITSEGINTSRVFQYVFSLIADEGKGPMAAVLMLVPVLVFSAIAESYTVSLRYTDTKEIMGTMVSLFFACMIIQPLTGLIASSVSVIKGAASLMTVYLPVMGGMLMFSGHAVASGGYYAAVVTVSQLVAKLASSFLSPLLNVFLALSVCSGVNATVRISGLVQMLGKLFKTVLTFAMSIYIAVIGLNASLSSAVDSVADKAAKFGMSSFIPIIGSSISEAYGAVRGGMNILRSGIGVFVIFAVLVSFAPLLIRVLMWSLAVFVTQIVGEALSVTSAITVLSALSGFLSALRATLIAVMTVFIISSATMLALGGHS